MLNNALWFLAGLVVYCIVLAVISWQERRARTRATLPPEGVPTEEFLPTAACATDMAPRFAPIDMTAARVRIVGGDGAYFCLPNKEKLAELLRDLVDRGAKVDYFLINPSDEALRSIRSLGLADLAGLTFKRFERMQSTVETLELACVLETKHPTTIRSPSGNALWLEGNHPPMSHHAYGVIFVPPEAMKGGARELFERSECEIDKLEQSCSVVSSFDGAARKLAA